MVEVDLFSAAVGREAARLLVHPVRDGIVAGGVAEDREGRELDCIAECRLRWRLTVTMEARAFVVLGMHAKQAFCISSASSILLLFGGIYVSQHLPKRCPLEPTGTKTKKD